MWLEVARTAGILVGLASLLGAFGWWMHHCEKQALEKEPKGQV